MVRRTPQTGQRAHRDQAGALFAFDEPSVGLHPQDVRTLVRVLDRLVDHGATVIDIEHDLDMVANADRVIDMGPGGGAAGGRVVAEGTPEQIAASDDSATGAYLANHLASGSRGRRRGGHRLVQLGRRPSRSGQRFSQATPSLSRSRCAFRR